MFNLKKKFDRWIQASGFFFGAKSTRAARIFSDSARLRGNSDGATSLGELGELQALRYLQELGYKIIAHGHRQRLGEIDLIAIDGTTIVFVEVKTWVSDDEADPSAAVDLSKQKKITRTALMYLKRQRLLNQACRFDVVSIVWNGSPTVIPRIRHFKAAFEAVGHGQLYC